MLTTQEARRMVRRNGLAADLAADLAQEAALADLQGGNGQQAADTLAKSLARHYGQNDDRLHTVASTTGQTDDRLDTVASTIGQADLDFAISVCSGETSIHDKAVSRQFSRIVAECCRKLALPIPN